MRRAAAGAGGGAWAGYPRTNMTSEYLLLNNPNDTSDYVNNGTLRNSPTYTADRDGNANSALLLNGTTQYMDAANDSGQVASTEMTVFMVVNFGLTEYSFVGFCQKGLSGGNTGQWSLYKGNPNALYFFQYDNGGTAVTLASFPSLPVLHDGNFHSIAARNDGTSAKCFVDGVPGSGEDVTPLTGALRTDIGNFMVGRAFAGAFRYRLPIVDDCVTWDVGKTDAEILAIHNGVFGL